MFLTCPSKHFKPMSGVPSSDGLRNTRMLAIAPAATTTSPFFCGSDTASYGVTVDGDQPLAAEGRPLLQFSWTGDNFTLNWMESRFQSDFAGFYRFGDVHGGYSSPYHIGMTSTDVSSAWSLTAPDRITAVSACCRDGSKPDPDHLSPGALADGPVQRLRLRRADGSVLLIGSPQGPELCDVPQEWVAVPAGQLLAGFVSKSNSPASGSNWIHRIAYVFAGLRPSGPAAAPTRVSATYCGYPIGTPYSYIPGLTPGPSGALPSGGLATRTVSSFSDVPLAASGLPLAAMRATHDLRGLADVQSVYGANGAKDPAYGGNGTVSHPHYSGSVYGISEPPHLWLAWSLRSADRIVQVRACCDYRLPTNPSFAATFGLAGGGPVHRGVFNIQLLSARGVVEVLGDRQVYNPSCEEWVAVPEGHLFAGVVWSAEDDYGVSSYYTRRVAFVFAEPLPGYWQVPDTPPPPPSPPVPQPPTFKPPSTCPPGGCKEPVPLVGIVSAAAVGGAIALAAAVFVALCIVRCRRAAAGLVTAHGLPPLPPPPPHREAGGLGGFTGLGAPPPHSAIAQPPPAAAGGPWLSAARTAGAAAKGGSSGGGGPQASRDYPIAVVIPSGLVGDQAGEGDAAKPLRHSKSGGGAATASPPLQPPPGGPATVTANGLLISPTSNDGPSRYGSLPPLPGAASMSPAAPALRPAAALAGAEWGVGRA
ncbi:hypothetical protein GPECTOR_24g267 [Gonium pectorale]|uniref:Uncharacterized protein n=1 Tax=Gonium pectorale TaxID=33097 RepID=A0A150GGL4_GONPE|nr:hypothetical protein GPECTOR_24g267 [Gonium pectorale]|eukprot:KXZ48977.1 hypothetical protein GPECTOR_24g267 [Gonium pectorale]